MRPLRYSFNVTLDGCCDHRAIPPNEDVHRHAAEKLNQADALLFGRVTFEPTVIGAPFALRLGGQVHWFAQSIRWDGTYVTVEIEP
jgi:hypothetical protein